MFDVGSSFDAVVEIEQLSARHGCAEAMAGEEDEVVWLDLGLATSARAAILATHVLPLLRAVGLEADEPGHEGAGGDCTASAKFRARAGGPRS